MKKFLTISEVARHCQRPVSVLLRLEQAGTITPDAETCGGRFLLFDSAKLAEIERVVSHAKPPQQHLHKP